MDDEVTIDLRLVGADEAAAGVQRVTAAQQQMSQAIQQGASQAQQGYQQLTSQQTQWIQGLHSQMNSFVQDWNHLVQQAQQGNQAALAQINNPVQQAVAQGIAGYNQQFSQVQQQTQQTGQAAAGGFWSSFRAAFRNAQQQQGSQIQNSFRDTMKSLLSTAALVGLLKGSLDQATAGQATELQFEDAFTRFPKLADTSIEKINELAEARKRLTRFDEDSTKASFAQLASLRLTGTQITDLIPLVQDYAAKTGKDMDAATRSVSSALMGNSEALRDIDVNFKATGSSAYDYTQLVAALRQQVGGFAEKEGASSASTVERATRAWNDFQGVVGTFVLPVLTGLLEFGERNQGWLVPLAAIIIGVTVAWKALTGAIALSSAVMSANPVFLIAAAIAGIITAAILLRDKWGEVWDWIGDKVTWVWNHSIGWIVNRIIDAAKWVGSLFSSPQASGSPVPGDAGMAGNADVGAVPGLARGGVLPGYAPGRDSIHALLSPGEGVLVPEVTRAIGADTIHSWNRWGVQQRFAFGGIAGTGYAKDPISEALERSRWQSVFSVDGKNASASATGNLAAIVAGAVQGAVGAVGGDPVQRWRGLATQALQMTGQYTPENLDAMMQRIGWESSGNPNAVNNWDRNAKNGTPSQGLLQVIPPTFKQYAMPGYDTNILDPLSNMLASIRYASDRYGSVSAAYLRKNADGSVAGYDSGGWLPPGGIAVSGLDKPEAVLTPDQWDTMKSAADRPHLTLGAGAITINTNDPDAMLRALQEHFGDLADKYARDRRTKAL